MLKKIDHIGVAVQSLEQVKSLFAAVFGLEPEFEETVEEQKVRAAGFRIGESKIEFLEPTSPESPIAKFLEKRGEGLHHVALSVDDIVALLGKMKAQGLRLIDEAPRTGAEGKKIAFVHPKSVSGILLELSQENS